MHCPDQNLMAMFERSLNLKAPWRVCHVEFLENEPAVHVYVDVNRTAKFPCPICGGLSPRWAEEDGERVWRHGDVVFYPCHVHCRRPRICCQEHKIHVVPAPWERPLQPQQADI